MPRDLDSLGDYPKVTEYLTHDPWPKKKEDEAAKKKKKKKKVAKKKEKTLIEEEDTKMRKLLKNEKGQYKVNEFGNYPLLRGDKWPGGILRMSLPCDADWEIRPKPVKKDSDDEDE